MSNKELIEQAREAIDNMDAFARMANVVATGPMLVLNSAIDALELADKRIAELEEEVKRYMAAFELAYQQAMTNGEAANKAERKLAVARDELLRCKRIMLHECGIGLVNEVVLAQIGGE